MLQQARGLLFAFLITVLLGACSKVPDNARYVPDDAVIVAGINLSALSDKIAWNLITGSKLFKEIKKRMPAENAGDIVGGIENAGLDVSNTFYVYTKYDTRFAGGKMIAGLIPIKDAKSLEGFLKKAFPGVAIVQRQEMKEAALGGGLYARWSANLLIVIDAPLMPQDDEEAATDSAANVVLAAEMDKAFNVPGTNSIINNKRFSGFEAHRHDLSFWVNYGSILSGFSDDGSLNINGVTLSPAMLKDAVLTAGFEFRKGQIAADVNYYLPSKVEEATKDFGTVEADKEMLDRLPKNNMDMLLAMHISPAGVKTLLEKAGLFGLTNMGLATQGLDADFLLEAFTGDMAVMMSDFSLAAELKKDEFMGQVVEHKSQKVGVTMTYVIRINKKENFERLMELVKKNGMQPLKGGGYVLPLTTSDSVFLLLNEQYAVISSKRKYAAGFLDGSFKKDKMGDLYADQVYGQPFAMCIDVKELFRNIDPAISNSPRDSAIISESKKLLDNITVTGGKYEDNAYKFGMEVNFINTDENSILELIDFGMKIKDLADKRTL